MRLDDVRPIHALDVLVSGETWPGLIHTIDHPDGLVLVDTGMIDSTPELDKQWHPTIYPDRIPRDAVLVINTHLDFDHCGGNRLFAGRPIYVQAVEREVARTGRTIVEWADFEGATYVELEGKAEILPGVRVLPTPGHSPGHQSVLVDTDEGLVILGGDVGHTWEEFDASESGRLLLDLGPRRVWLSHQADPRDF
jgi:N-acyl homoserine lactone hydrolase